MKHLLLSTLILLLACAAPLPAADEPFPVTNSDKDKASFFIGNQLGAAFAQLAGDVDMDLVVKSAREALAGQASKLNDTACEDAMSRFYLWLKNKKSALSKKPPEQPAAIDPLEKENASYVFGRNLANSIEGIAPELNLDFVFSTYVKAAKGGTFKVNMADMEAATKAHLKKAEAAMHARMAEKNKKAGEAFLEANKKKEGIITTASGLQYKIIKQGAGPKPTLKDQVTLNYKGALIDGTVFDSTYERNRPATSPLDGTIDGWIEVLQLMPEGSKWHVAIPSNLAFGEPGRKSQNGGIQPNSTLLYELELLKVTPPETVVKPK